MEDEVVKKGVVEDQLVAQLGGVVKYKICNMAIVLAHLEHTICPVLISLNGGGRGDDRRGHCT